MSTTKNFLKEIGALSVVVVLILTFFGEMIFTPAIPLFRDLGPYFYPMRFSLRESFQSWELPLWDRHLAMGFPLLANFQSGAFYPLHFAYFFLPFLAAIKFIFLLHSLIAAIGTYALMRHWGYERLIAVVAAIMFSLGGCTVSLLNLLNHFQAAVWFPWLLLLGERQLISNNKPSILAFIFVAALQFLSGSPEIYAMSMIVHCANGLRIASEGRTLPWQVFSSFLKVNVLVAGLAMAQILPTLELLREAGRIRALSFEGTATWSLHPLGLLNLFLLDREVDVGSFDRFRSFTSLPAPLLMSLYMGALFPFGLWSWLRTATLRHKVSVLAGTALSLSVSIGSYTPIYRLLYEYVPFAYLVRFPEKFFFITFALLIHVTAYGLSTLLTRGESLSRAKAWLGPAALCFIFVGVEILLRASGDWRYLGPSAQSLVWDRPAAAGLIFSLDRQIALFLLLGTVFIVWDKDRVGKNILGVLLVGIVVADLYSAHRPYQFLSDPDLLTQKPEILRRFNEPSFYRVFFISAHNPLHPVAALFSGARSPAENTIFGIESLRPNAGRFWQLDYVQDIDALARQSSDLLRAVARQLKWNEFYRLLGALNNGYLISQKELPAQGISLVSHFPNYPLWLYRIEQVVPRAYIANQTLYEREPMKAIKLLAAPKFDPRKEVIVEEPIRLGGDDSFNGQAKILSYSQSRVTIQASLNQAGLLVLADSYYPGWKVYVDGREQEIMRANFFFRGVQLTPGDHQVEFEYRPASLRYGLGISLLTSGYLVVSAVRRRKALRGTKRLNNGAEAEQ